jgi:hypothetical protein
MARTRAARSLAAIEAAQRALRTAITTPTRETEARAGWITVRTPRAQEHPRCVTLGADELHALLRVITPKNWRKPEKRKHLVVCEALALALGRLGDITTTPDAAVISAARLANRELAKWLARHATAAAAHTTVPKISISRVLTAQKTRSLNVPPPAEPLFSKPPARKTPDQRWRNRTPEDEAEYLRLRLFSERLARPRAEPEQLAQIERRIARLEARHRLAVATLATQETAKHGKKDFEPGQAHDDPSQPAAGEEGHQRQQAAAGADRGCQEAAEGANNCAPRHQQQHRRAAASDAPPPQPLRLARRA